ncbi:MAG: 2-amino-4-hydroxy-6-hydroxymethyldihydropteridine diphosphokinase [Desulfuromonadales bacterium]|nr:2-amino-4-hydroxy-6-hydroxymethyldihydropteridine diphosphokinase [Desulfuromonadales bacterium]
MEKEIYIGLGSNLGDREMNLLRGVAELGKLPDSKITGLSSFYETKPVSEIEQDDYYNAVLRMESELTPQELLERLLGIETDIFLRKRVFPNEARRMDMDLLFYGNQIINNSPDLIIPHPRLHLRRFVLEPMAEIAPNFVHTVLQKPISELLAELTTDEVVTKI